MAPSWTSFFFAIFSVILYSAYIVIINTNNVIALSTHGVGTKIRARGLQQQQQSSSASSHEQITLRQFANQIIAFGDSLTAGLDPNTMTWKPYAIELQRLFDIQSDANVTVKMEGVSGERTDEMIPRLEEIMLKEKDKHKAHRVVIILGGTNDLGSRKSVEFIYDNLVLLHKIATKYDYSLVGKHKKTYTIAVTIPDCFWKINHDVRKAVNKKLKDLAAQSQNIYLFDLEAITLQTNKSTAAYWGRDLVHFTAAGYEYFGKKLYEFLDSQILK